MRLKYIKTAAVFMALALVILALPMNTAKAEGTPRVVLSGYTLEENYEAGTDSVLHLYFANMSASEDVAEVLVTYASSNDSIVPVIGSSNQFYITKIAAGKTVAVSVPVHLNQSKNAVYEADFAVQYSLEDETTRNNGFYIWFPDLASTTLTVKNIYITPSTFVGATSLISASLINGGTGKISDLVLKVTDGADFSAEYPMGSLLAGESAYFENDITFPMAGSLDLNVSVSYTDPDGTVRTVDCGKVGVVVMERATGSSSLDKDDVLAQAQQQAQALVEAQAATQKTTITIGIIAVSIIILVIVLISLFRKKKGMK